MYTIEGPAGDNIIIPETLAEDKPYFTPQQVAEASQHLNEHGYTVIRGLISKELCDAANASFKDTVKKYGDYLYRQTTANPELHKFNEQGFMMNPILNVQDLPNALRGFREVGLNIITHPHIRAFFKVHFGESAKIVQSMYFEGNPTTWAHQDTYYLDAEKIGVMTAAWFALEDIKPGAGRFYVYPGSQRIDVKKNGGDFDIAFNHKRYKELMKTIIREQKLECAAPALQKGDVLLWNSKTIHGSLKTTQAEYSRSSLTGHYIPSSMRFLQLQSRIKGLALGSYNGMEVHYPKPLDKFSKRMVLKIETSFPKTFQLVKRMAVKIVTSRK